MNIRNSEAAFICGIDEVGRGPLAGPVVASAVILPRINTIAGLRDSKTLNHAVRAELAEIIQEKSLATGTGWVWHDEIDRINIHHASLRAMITALDESLNNLPEEIPISRLMIRIDGKFLPDLHLSQFNDLLPGCNIQAVVKGDRSIPAISAASILAKVTRDRWMEEYHQIEPEYGFNKHKGYPTPAHKKAIRIHGPSAIQRRTFRYEETPL